MGFSEHSLILKNDGTLWGCGYNYYGNLGLEDTTDRNTFTQITINTDNIKEVYCGYYHTFILKNDGTLWTTGYNDSGRLGLGDTTNRTTFTEVTTNAGDIKSFPNQYIIPTIIKVLYTNPAGTYINCLVSFDQKQTWKTFNGTSWSTISDTSSNNILLSGMDISKVNKLDKNKLIAGGFTGDIDFRIAMKTNDNTVTPSITKIYILYC